MVFSSPVFLFLFLPLVLAGGFLLRKTAGNVFMLVASLFFYAWGEGLMVLLLCASILINYLAGLGIATFKGKSAWVLAAAVVVNILLLFYFKYVDYLLVKFDLLNVIGYRPITRQAFPLGISFFTFQGISYLHDVYREDAIAQKNPLLLGLYMGFFPQIASGPINRYPDIAPQLTNRTITLKKASEGLIRFTRGLAKKVIIANTLGLIATQIFTMPANEIPTSIAWIGMVFYTLQIYFDFSGYTDMAIGLALVFGFEFKENFNYPYIARSIQEFWQRWHISLSSWLRDYLFRPLSIRMRNLGGIGLALAVLITFIVCGVWHAPGLNFLIWGLWHGILLILEQVRVLRFNKLPVFIKRIYVLMAVMVGWVFFRAETLDFALEFFKRLIGLSPGHNFEVLFFINGFTLFVFLLALIFSMPVRKSLNNLVETRLTPVFAKAWSVGRYPFYLLLFFAAVVEMAQSGYAPFIYFNF